MEQLALYLGVWAVGAAPFFENRMQSAGFAPETHFIRAHGTKTVVFVGRLGKGARQPEPRPAVRR